VSSEIENLTDFLAPLVKRKWFSAGEPSSWWFERRGNPTSSGLGLHFQPQKGLYRNHRQEPAFNPVVCHTKRYARFLTNGNGYPFICFYLKCPELLMPVHQTEKACE
jgi:hypothetical protein